MKIVKIVLWVVAIAAGLFLFYRSFLAPNEIRVNVQSEALREVALFKEVSATGTINPIEIVEIGTQVSGNISQIFVDFNHQVKKGQVLAKMDMRNLITSLTESKSNLSKSELTLRLSKREKDRMDRLALNEAIKQIEVDKANDNYQLAIENAKIAKLQVERNKVNLGYATIVSPIDGIIISRNIDVGQTVAASFATPTLFRIANDLGKMKIEASVDEADIGQVVKGQQVEFTVDTYADEVFYGVVEEVQLQPIIIQNVVTYNVIVLIDNPDNKLLPGMTATLIIKTIESPLAPVIPNAALAFVPDEEHFDALRKKGFQILKADKHHDNTVWIREGNQLKELAVQPIFTNGIHSALAAQSIVFDSVITNLGIEVLEEKKSGNLFMRGSDD